MVSFRLDEKQMAVAASQPRFVDGLDPVGQPFFKGRNPAQDTGLVPDSYSGHRYCGWIGQLRLVR